MCKVTYNCLFEYISIQCIQKDRVKKGKYTVFGFVNYMKNEMILMQLFEVKLTNAESFKYYKLSKFNTVCAWYISVSIQFLSTIEI